MRPGEADGSATGAAEAKEEAKRDEVELFRSAGRHRQQEEQEDQRLEQQKREREQEQKHHQLKVEDEEAQSPATTRVSQMRAHADPAAPGEDDAAAAAAAAASAAHERDADKEESLGHDVDFDKLIRLGLGASANVALSSSAPAAAGGATGARASSSSTTSSSRDINVAAAQWTRYERPHPPCTTERGLEEGEYLRTPDDLELGHDLESECCSDESDSLDADDSAAKTNAGHQETIEVFEASDTNALPSHRDSRLLVDDLEAGADPNDPARLHESSLLQPLLTAENDAGRARGSPGGSTGSVEECRICGDDECTKDNPLIAPCACTGSISKVHVACLEKWILNRPGNRAAGDNLDCEICHTRYSVTLHHRLKLDFKSLCSFVTLSDLLEAFALLVSAACLISTIIVDIPAMHEGHPDQSDSVLLIFVAVWTVGLVSVAARRLFIRWRRTTSVPRVRAMSV